MLIDFIQAKGHSLCDVLVSPLLGLADDEGLAPVLDVDVVLALVVLHKRLLLALGVGELALGAAGEVDLVDAVRLVVVGRQHRAAQQGLLGLSLERLRMLNKKMSKLRDDDSLC